MRYGLKKVFYLVWHQLPGSVIFSFWMKTEAQHITNIIFFSKVKKA
jgi:hypothetical protein